MPSPASSAAALARAGLPRAEVERVVAAALAEDLPWGDLTTDNLLPSGLPATGVIEAREAGVLAGLPVAALVFEAVDPGVEVEALAAEGARLQPGQPVGRVRGDVASLLKAERVALNFLQRLSGIATQADRYVQAVAGLKARIVDTRKTTPGLRLLEKYAVRVGGANNHRYCLSDGVLVKDNHLAALRREGVGLREGLARLRARLPHTTKLEVEVESLEGVAEALAAGADVILLDNMAPAALAEAVRLVAGRALTEASGGITLQNVRAAAEAGVDLISIGALTHSPKALDLAMEIEE